MINIKYDFGIRHLVTEWKSLLSRKYLLDDTIAGLTVACIAIPLSLAIALASGVPPAVGLISAIIGGIVCALFGGTPLSVCGPAAAMSVLIAANVESFGVGGLLIICLICGFLQIISGVFGFGTLMKFVPLPVIGGFTAGIGAIIFIGQLPRVFGLPPPNQSHIFSVIMHIGNLFKDIHYGAFLIALLSFAFMQICPKINKKIPSPLFAIVVPTLILLLFPGNTISIIGDIPRSLPWPVLPKLPEGNLLPLVMAGISVYFLATLESLLSSSAVDKMVKKQKHDSNQELIGQGFGNVVTAFFGGIPITGVIARSALNVTSGAKTRRSSIIHSLILIACIFFLAPAIKYIPIPALAGVLISVALKMLDIKSFFSLFHVSKSDAYIFLITFTAIIFTDLLVGIQLGLAVTAIIALIKMTKTDALIDSYISSTVPVIRCSIKGSLTFISCGEIDRISEKLMNVSTLQTVVIDASKLKHMDMSGAALFSEFLLSLKARNIQVIIKNLNKNYENMILENSAEKILPFRVAHNELDILNQQTHSSNTKTIRDRLLHGTQLFKNSSKNKSLNGFETQGYSEEPHTLFITCSDSTTNPNLITSSDTGELFVIRNIGNVIPVYSEKNVNSESAAIEFALKKFNLKTIIICGHSNCGAIQTATKPQNHSDLNDKSILDKWLQNIKISPSDSNKVDSTCAKEAKENALNQLKNLFTYPLITEKMRSKKIDLFAWYYDSLSCNVEIYSEKNLDFMSIDDYKKSIDSNFETEKKSGATENIPLLTLK